MRTPKTRQSEPDELGIHRRMPPPEALMAHSTKTPYATQHQAGRMRRRDKVHRLSTPHRRLKAEYRAVARHLGLTWTVKGVTT